MPSDPQHLAQVRAALPAVRQYAYLNAGTCGPLPQPSIDAMAAAAHDQAIHGRIRMEVLLHDERQRVTELRAAFARALGADADEIALARNTTDGINTAVWGQPWRAGEEVVVTDLEYEGGVMPVYLAVKKFGLKLRTLRLLDADPADYPGIVAAELSDNSRLLVISHVSWANGALVPLKEVVVAAHAKGCRVAVDAAQSAGAVPLDLHDIGVDYYAAPGQKWLCGPEGIGALYVRRDEQERLSPTYTGFFALAMEENPHPWDCFGHMELAPDARRYESSSIYLPGMHGMLASLRWLEEEVGWDWALARTAELHRHARQSLSALPMLKVFTPQAAAGLLHFTLPDGVDVEQINDALVQRGIRIRTIPHMNCLRVSTGFWNTEAEIDELASTLRELLA